MAALNAEQANALANNFLGLAQAIGDFRYANWDKLTKDDNQQLGHLQRSILNCGEDMLVLSTKLVMDDVQSSIDQIKTVTGEIKDTIKELQDIQQGIDIAAAIITLGNAIISKNPSAIAKAIGGLKAIPKA